MTHMKIIIAALFIMVVPRAALAEPGQSTSHVAYIYPAGAQQGTKLHITAGGRNLRSVKQIHVSGEGVKASYIRSIPNFKKTYGDYIKQLQKELRAQQNSQRRQGKKKPADNNNQKKDKIVPPDHPIFNDLKQRSSEELTVLLRRFYKENKQKNRELDELALIQIEVEANARPGMREIRLHTSTGLSNPIRFFIGDKAEQLEREPNDATPNNALLSPPFIFNGQIAAGDIDLMHFKATAGQQLLIQAHARSIIPYLADAVPGWFQATLSLHDSSGNELAFVDDYRFSPDPVLFYRIPSSGTYTLKIRDSIYRGREDFVYRISVGQDPFITSIFPLGGSHGRNVQTQLSGWNLPRQQTALNTTPDPGTIQSLSIDSANSIPYAVDELPETIEIQNNNDIASAQKVKLPVIINGSIGSPHDKDVYRFEARPGDRIVAEVKARRLHSPLDSILRLTDAKGNVIAWNDDAKQLNLGMLTHHADSQLSARATKAGIYYLHLADTQAQGGEEYGYRLRISRPMPDFSLSSTPASISVKQGCSAPITVHTVRKDGFQGEIDIILKDAPKGFKLSGATIPAGAESVTMTLTAPVDTKNKLFEIRLQGRSKLDRHSVTRHVTPGQAMTQAFITKHIIPSQQMMVFVGGWGDAPEVLLSKNSRVRIPNGGSTKLRIKKTKSDASLVMKLYRAPEGITLVQHREGKNALSISLHADDQIQPGTAGNLMIEVMKEHKTKNKKTRLSSLGVMPAFPYIVE